MFPVFAGGMLLGLYAVIKFFGKDIVNYLILAYIAVGGGSGMKAALQSLTGNVFSAFDEAKVVDLRNVKWIGDITITQLDIIGLVMSIVSVGFYVWSKSWIYNNILAVVFCVHALQFIFLGNFKTGALLLSLLFIYDIFFVFGTDVMVTVAKNVDAPIKLQFPRDLSTSPPQYSILGLGDIVIPGIFMSFCLRFDVLKSLSKGTLEGLIDAERKGRVDNGKTMQYIITKGNEAPKIYFTSVIVGYLIAIITTVIIMFYFNHGQPALLYLVPGCILAIAITAVVKGEFKEVVDFVEERFYGAKEGEEGKKE
jgi:minor histocompatibility antigen H13